MEFHKTLYLTLSTPQRNALCYGNSHKIVFSWQQCVFFIHAFFHTVAYKATWHTVISSLCLVALPAKYVCVQQTHAAKLLLPNLREHFKIRCHVIATQSTPTVETSAQKAKD